MKTPYLIHNYFNSYYYSNKISNIIIDRWVYLGFISQFFDLVPIITLIKPWQKESIFHKFIYYVVSTTIEDESYESAVEQLETVKSRGEKELGQIYIERVFAYYKIECFPFKEFCTKDVNSIIEDDFYEYYNELLICADIEKLFKVISDEVFYILFNNRILLLNFNWIISSYIDDIVIEQIEDDFKEYSIYLKKDGQLKRKYIPKWVKNAVFYRDRGKCSLCKKDLSGLFSINNTLEFDHIIPLRLGGTNDVSNIQLLCKECNNKKGDKDIVTSNYYEKWF